MPFFHVERCRIEPLAQPELRKDPILDRWVIISTDRLGRPHEYAPTTPTESLPACPFCAGHEHLTPTPSYVDPPRGPWRVRVVANTFPAVRGHEPTEFHGDAEWHSLPATGRHEVVIACPQHEANLARLGPDHLAALCRAFRERIRGLKRERPELYPLVFNNHRAAAGASLEHAHAQIIALPMVPELVARETDAGHRHHERTGRCAWCDFIAHELSAGRRVVVTTPRFAVIAAYAARFPFELWILPRAHASHFETLTDVELTELGIALKDMLVKLDRGLDDPPYNLVLHTAPPAGAPSPSFHWHLEILPRLTGAAGFEWGTGMNINPVPPEQAAGYLRLI